MEDNDAQLQLKKRARRRLVGAVAFVSVVAIVLPMVMDHEPRQVVQDVEIRIPGQDEKPFAPKFAAPPVVKPAEKPVESPSPQPAAVPQAALTPTAKVLEVVKDKEPNKPSPKAEKALVKEPVKVLAKPEKAAEKSPLAKVEKPAEKPLARDDDAKRAAAILSGQALGAKPAATKSGEFLVLIGAFSNEANVKTLKAKLNEQGIKMFTEPLDTPQGKKTRVRAGPFPNREAAVKAQAKMQRIGVSGVVAAKQ